MLRQGKDELRVIQQCLKFNQPLPKNLVEMPILQPELEWLLGAFFDLHTCRAPDGTIPWTAVYMWAKAHNIHSDHVPYFSRLIFDMDLAYLDYRTEEMAKAHKKGGKKGAIRQNQKGIKTKGN